MSETNVASRTVSYVAKFLYFFAMLFLWRIGFSLILFIALIVWALPAVGVGSVATAAGGQNLGLLIAALVFLATPIALGFGASKYNVPYPRVSVDIGLENFE